MNIQSLFEDELRRRGLAFSIDPESGRHALKVGELDMLISLDNLQRDVARDGDLGRISTFVDAITAPEVPWSADGLYWTLEPSDYEVEALADFRHSISDKVDRVLVYLSPDRGRITWVTPEILRSLKLSEAEAGERACANLAHALTQAELDGTEIDGVHLGFIGTTLPFKASLILAPNLREVVEAAYGWPLLAVVPDRDFLYLWAARHTSFIQRVGGAVVNQFSKAAYPISTEVYEITDDGIHAIGEFPKVPSAQV